MGEESGPQVTEQQDRAASTTAQENVMSDEPKLRNVITYSSNNSGGYWWLDDAAWQALADAGWIVHWWHDAATAHGGLIHEPSRYAGMGHDHRYVAELVPAEPTGERWLGALATGAAKETTDPAAAIAEWERVTGQSASDEGCNCCGEPHSFTFYDENGDSRYSSVEVVRTELHWS